MTDARTWNKTWFGFWREDGPGFDDCPSVANWVEPLWKTRVNIRRIRQYLDGAACVWAESPPEMCSICLPPLRVGKGYKTDGVWYWPGQLAHQIETHDIRLPDDFEERIVAAAGAVQPNLWRNERDFVETLRHLQVPNAHYAAIQHFVKLREG